jgi:hypothetical protein
MKTEIDQIRLQLPQGMERRAQRIGRLLGESLARRTDLPAGSFARLRVGPLSLDPGHGDRAIADRIADSLVRAIRSETGAQPTSSERSPRAVGRARTPSRPLGPAA